MKYSIALILMLFFTSCTQGKVVFNYEKNQTDKGVATVVKNNNKKIVEIKGQIIKPLLFTNIDNTKVVFESNYWLKNRTLICEVWYIDGMKNNAKLLFAGESQEICADPDLNYLFVQDNGKTKEVGMPVVEVYTLPDMVKKYEKTFPEFSDDSISVDIVYYKDGKFYYKFQNDFQSSELLEINLEELQINKIAEISDKALKSGGKSTVNVVED